jgi:hypothetical protein
MTSDREAGLTVRLDVQSPVDHAVPLVAVGVIAPVADEPLQGSVARLDQLLGGAIEDLRRRDGGPRLGESRLLISAPGVSAPRVLLVGLGAARDVRTEALAVAGRVAVQQALELGVSAIGFAPGLRDAGVNSLGIEEVARAVVEGARLAFATAAPGRSLVFALEVSASHRESALEGIASASRATTP